MEKWKQIEGFPNYMISDNGNVKSVDRMVFNGNVYFEKKSRILKQYKAGEGYLYVKLRNNGTEKAFSVHRLVAIAFVPNPMCKPQVNHIDGNKCNNNAENLEWCTLSENLKHRYTVLGQKSPMYGKKMSDSTKHKMKESHIKAWTKEMYIAKAKKCQKRVICIEQNKIYESVKQASLETGATRSRITRVCKHRPKAKTAGGYHWEYV